MTISELITHLEKLRIRQGDIEVPWWLIDWAVDPENLKEFCALDEGYPKRQDYPKEVPRHLFPESVKEELRQKGLL